MRAYSASDQESVRARDLLKDWAGEGFLSEAQYQQMEQETVCELRRTDIFLRIVLFLFTLLIVGAAVALFFVVLLPQPSIPVAGVSLLIFAALFYGTAELAVSRARFYRYGIEEAFAACSVGFLCAGMQAFRKPEETEFFVAAVGIIVSVWIWHRFGLPYATPVAMIFVLWLARSCTASPSAQHMIVAAIYAAGVITVAAVRPRHRLTYLNDQYSVAEALLWLGIYLVINLQLSSPDLLLEWLGGPLSMADKLPRPFYWATWVLTWCLPPIVLARGLRLKDRFVLAVGAIAAILTLVTNKPYLGWPGHTWDPMLLGALLVGIALFVRRWLAAGPGEIRHGFTARRLSGKDKAWLNGMSAGAAAFALVPRAGGSDVHFGGGESGGGGASSDF